MTIFIDIETLPTERQDVIAEIRSSIKPPATYKKEESIKAWLEENIDAETDAAVRKTALDGAFGRVCVVGLAFDDQGPTTFHSVDDERFLLESTNQVLANFRASEHFTITLVGHNVAAFDLRFLLQRYIVNGITPHPIVVRAAGAKPWESDKVFDTMVQWAGAGNRISLDKLCKALSIPTPKGDITGATVYDAVKAGRIEEVAEYCKRDVEAVRQIFNKMRFK